MDQFVLGWSPLWDQFLNDAHGTNDNLVRITAKHRSSYEALRPSGASVNCYLSGLARMSLASSELPAVGDWCIVGEGFLDAGNSPSCMIEQVLPRKSKLSRGASGVATDEQVLAANVDVVFVVTSINRDFNINRLRRYMLLARNGGCTPVVVLSKTDLPFADVWECVDAVNSEFPDVEVIQTSSVTGTGIERIQARLAPGQTGVFVGSSGVGKSTLVNILLSQDVQKTGSIREADQRGRHTTSSSGLFFTASGGIVIDTPGLREIQVLGEQNNLRNLMPTVPELASQCRFADCRHADEPDCAVKEALANGTLAAAEFEAYIKLERELSYARRKTDQRAAIDERKRWKRIAMQQRQRKNDRGKLG